MKNRRVPGYRDQMVRNNLRYFSFSSGKIARLPFLLTYFLIRRNAMKTENITNPQAYTCTHVLNKKLQEFDTWMKNMNYRLLLEHTHSDEYYKRKQLYL